MKKRFRNLIGPQVRALRWKRGLTQEELAARLQVAGATGLDRVKIAKIESQIRSVFDYELLAIAHVLGVSPGYLAPRESVLFEKLPVLSAWTEQGT
jgi:transcriptional regulator with XRE-family HTH domain